mgnify:CR=1 FL=1
MTWQGLSTTLAHNLRSTAEDSDNSGVLSKLRMQVEAVEKLKPTAKPSQEIVKQEPALVSVPEIPSEKLSIANEHWSIALLRYFNPVGAHKSARIGEDPLGIPNNLMPYLTQVVVGCRKKLSIFGHDYPTQDGTCERDFIHVVDLAKAHVLAVENRLKNKGCRAWNIGTGVPISVLQIKNTFEKVNGVQVNSEFVSRRAGDLASFYADASRANKELNWTPELTLEDMLADSWNWQKQNPTGYKA